MSAPCSLYFVDLTVTPVAWIWAPHKSYGAMACALELGSTLTLRRKICNKELHSNMDVKHKNNGGYLPVKFGPLEGSSPCVDGTELH